MEEYKELKLDVILFDAEDVITESPYHDDDGQEM